MAQPAVKITTYAAFWPFYLREHSRVETRWLHYAGTALTFLFLDGNHTEEVAQHDFAMFARHLLPGGLLAVHDVFPDPRDGGQPPWHVVQRALRHAVFTQVSEHGSLRVLERSTSTLSL